MKQRTDRIRGIKHNPAYKELIDSFGIEWIELIDDVIREIVESEPPAQNRQ